VSNNDKQSGSISRDDITPPETIACAICLKEVPASVASAPEGNDYALHFCGVECHEQWLKQAKTGSDSGQDDDEA